MIWLSTCPTSWISLALIYPSWWQASLEKALIQLKSRISRLPASRCLILKNLRDNLSSLTQNSGLSIQIWWVFPKIMERMPLCRLMLVIDYQNTTKWLFRAMSSTFSTWIRSKNRLMLPNFPSRDCNTRNYLRDITSQKVTATSSSCQSSRKWNLIRPNMSFYVSSMPHWQARSQSFTMRALSQPWKMPFSWSLDS